MVYVAESTRQDGSKKVYVGKTQRSPFVRWGEHMKSQSRENSKSWVSRGKFFRPIGAVWSSNPDKAEKTIKKLSPKSKIEIGRKGARKFKKSSWW